MRTYTNNTLEENPATVAQLATAHPGALAVFTKYNIDYCYGGHRSLEDACIRIGLDLRNILFKPNLLAAVNFTSPALNT